MNSWPQGANGIFDAAPGCRRSVVVVRQCGRWGPAVEADHYLDLAAPGNDIAFVFPGQGSQFVGMGKRLHEASEAARRVFQQADEILGFSLSKLCFEGPADELEDTINAQPAI